MSNRKCISTKQYHEKMGQEVNCAHDFFIFIAYAKMLPFNSHAEVHMSRRAGGIHFGQNFIFIHTLFKRAAKTFACAQMPR